MGVCPPTDRPRHRGVMSCSPVGSKWPPDTMELCFIELISLLKGRWLGGGVVASVSFFGSQPIPTLFAFVPDRYADTDPFHFTHRSSFFLPISNPNTGQGNFAGGVQCSARQGPGNNLR
jgi:hypothetical protein